MVILCVSHEYLSIYNHQIFERTQKENKIYNKHMQQKSQCKMQQLNYSTKNIIDLEEKNIMKKLYLSIFYRFICHFLEDHFFWNKQHSEHSNRL